MNKLAVLPMMLAAFTIGSKSLKATVQKPDSAVWTRNVELGFSAAQATFSSNWKSGGTNNLSVLSYANLKGKYTRGKHSWEQKFNLLYGLIKNQGEMMRKSQDLLLITSDYNYAISPKLQAFAGVTFQSQADRGFEYKTDSTGSPVKTLISGFMSPGQLIEAFGFKYAPVPFWWVKFGLGATRQTFMLNQRIYAETGKELISNVPRGQKVINEAGLQIQSEFSKDVKPNIRITARYLGFGPFNDLEGGFDSRLDFMATARLTKFLTTNITAVAILDKNQHKNWQLSQIFGIGLAYKR
jgi:hypothetical protein